MKGFVILTNSVSKPEWLKVRQPGGALYRTIKLMTDKLNLSTVCQEAKCPNMGECWSGGTATIMLMGDTCTRACRFCAVKTGNPKGWLDPDEPDKVLDTVRKLALEYLVLTSVDRDDLPDGGAEHFAKTVEFLKSNMPDLVVETLIPDFKGKKEPLDRFMDSNPDVIGQNIETVKRLTHEVRDRRAGYEQTLSLLQRVKERRPDIFTKSSIMLGLGETDSEIQKCMADLRDHGVDILTLGQYLKPTSKHLEVKRFVTPQEFKMLEKQALDMGFLCCASGPLVRSSYKAAEFFIQEIVGNRRNS